MLIFFYKDDNLYSSRFQFLNKNSLTFKMLHRKKSLIDLRGL